MPFVFFLVELFIALPKMDLTDPSARYTATKRNIFHIKRVHVKLRRGLFIACYLESDDIRDR